MPAGSSEGAEAGCVLPTLLLSPPSSAVLPSAVLPSVVHVGGGPYPAPT